MFTSQQTITAIYFCFWAHPKQNINPYYLHKIIIAIDQCTINIYLDINKEAILYSLA